MAEHVDVLIVGAGLSGVGAACHLRRSLPGLSVAVLEGRQAIGGTWDLFRYPGVRSDSDMFTLGYAFRPWNSDRAIADGASILQYVRDTAAEYGVDRLVRFGHRVVGASWSSADARWTVDVERVTTGADGVAVTDTVQLTCSFLYACSGYYRYDRGYDAGITGLGRFAGTVVHPQFWPADLDFDGKRVVVIGSGATAVTLVPSLARSAAHVTMLQRSPSYVLSLPSRDPMAVALRALPGRISYPIVRWKNVLVAVGLFQLSRHRPEGVKRFIRKQLVRQLPAGFDIDKHFAPRYNPWDQRLCLVPDSDLFRAIRAGTVSIATDTITTVTENGVELASGEHLDADIIVTATGLEVLPVGGLELTVDGSPVVLNETVSYKGMMLSGVPNFALTVGYTNASWTLKADLVASFVCRLLEHLRDRGYSSVVAVAPPATGAEIPLIDLESGYLQRARHLLPKQGARPPWRVYQNYPRDVLLFTRAKLEDGVLQFSRRTRSPAA